MTAEDDTARTPADRTAGRATDPPTVLVVGVGLVGASIAYALTRAGWPVHLRDRIPSHAMVAAGLGAGTVADPEPAEVDVVVVAVPPDACAAVVTDCLLRYPNATVTDVASVKGRVITAVTGETGRFVGSHPMAGSHRSGPVTADPELFVDRTWVITPHPANPPERIEVVRRVATACRAQVVVMTPDEHDGAVAAVSHLPHLAAVLVAGQLLDLPEDHVRLSGQGLRDVTRIAGSDPGLWVQILAGNAPALRPRLERLRDGLDALLAGLDDRTELSRTLHDAVDGTHRIPGKHGRAPVDWAEVVVEIPDTPGALARLFADVDAAGINVEDIAIEHDQMREVGFLAVSVAPEGTERLRGRLVDAGWSVRA